MLPITDTRSRFTVSEASSERQGIRGNRWLNRGILSLPKRSNRLYALHGRQRWTAA